MTYFSHSTVSAGSNFTRSLDLKEDLIQDQLKIGTSIHIIYLAIAQLIFGMSNGISISGRFVSEVKSSNLNTLSPQNCNTQTRENNIATISQMWASISMQITEYNNIIVIPVKMFALWGLQDQTFLLCQYRNITDNDGMFVADPILPRIFLGPVDHFRSKYLHYSDGCLPTLGNPIPNDLQRSTMAALPRSHRNLSSLSGESPRTALGDSRQNSSRGAQKRPPNSWILYRKSKHAETVSSNPGLTNNQISTLISCMWAAEPVEVRSAYKALADRVKQQHAAENPGYRYKPRKSSEVKRRQKRKLVRASSPLYSLSSIQQPQNAQVNESIDQILSEQDSESQGLTSRLSSSWTPETEIIEFHQGLTSTLSSAPTAIDFDKIGFEQYFDQS